MATFPVAGSFTGTGSLAESAGGVKRRKAISTPTIPATITGSATVTLDVGQIQFKRVISDGFYLIDNVDFALNEDLLTIARSQLWWDKSYTYRRVLQLPANTEGYELDHPFYAVLSKDLIQQQKVRPDMADIEVLRLVSAVPEQWTIVPKKVETTPQDDSIVVRWPSESEVPPGVGIEDLYYIYYGNQNLANVPEQLSYEPVEWPVSYDHTARHLTYTRPGEHWVGDTAFEDGARVTMNFYGSDIRILANTGPNFGIAEVQIDDGAWEEADLFSPVASANQEVYAKHDLGPGYHVIRYRRSGYKSPVSLGYEINLQAFEYVRHNGFINLMEEADESLMWGSVIGGVVGK